MRDYTGDMSYFENQLKDAGISEEEFDIGNYVGCTFNELQALVNWQIAKKRGSK